MKRSRADLIALLLIALGTVAYLSALPRNLNPSDEAVHLYEARRLLAGEVMYRDIFEIITPGWMYLMAGLFWLFGTDFATARIAMAVMHAATMGIILVTCRRLGVRRELAWAASLAYLPLAQAAWPIASQHWLSTFLCQLVLLVLIRGQQHTTRGAFTAGVLLGILIGVQQQRGVIMAGGIALWLMIDAMVERRPAGSPAIGRHIWARIAPLAAGGALVLLPLLSGLILAAGFEPVWRALVVHPLVNYGGTTHCEWGHVNVMTWAQSTFTFPRTLTYLPVVLVVLVPRLLVGLWRRDEGAHRIPLLLTAFTLVSMLSIAYFPDFIHIAFIAGVFIVAAADSCEWLLRRLPLLVGRASGLALTMAVLAVAVPQLWQNYVRLQRHYPISRSTAFGRVDFANADEAGLYDRVDALLDTTPGRELYCYPIIAHLYLLTAAHNPTRYGFFLSSYNSPDQLEEVVGTLKRKRLPYIVAFPAFAPANDPVIAYVRSEYEPIGTGAVDGSIFRRKGL